MLDDSAERYNADEDSPLSVVSVHSDKDAPQASPKFAVPRLPDRLRALEPSPNSSFQPFSFNQGGERPMSTFNVISNMF